jgi:hypothetical protein
MALNTVELHRYIKIREVYLKCCESTVRALRITGTTSEAVLKMLEQEVFFLEDQLDSCYKALRLLQDEPASHEKVLQKV